MRRERLTKLLVRVVPLVIVLIAGGCGSAPSPLPKPVKADDATPTERTKADVQSRAGGTLLDLLKPLAVSPDGGHVAVGLDGVTLYDRSGQGTVVTAKGKKIRGVYWSPQGHWLLANATGPTILLIGPDTGVVIDLTDQFRGLQDAKLTVSWSPDERVVLVSEGWRTAEQSTVWLVQPDVGAVRQVVTATKLEHVQWIQGGNGVLQVGAGCCGPMNLFIRLADGTSLPEKGFFGGGSFSPDARFFALAPYMGASLAIRDLETDESRTFWKEAAPGDPSPEEGRRYRILPALWSPDGRYLAVIIETSSENGKAPTREMRIVDAADGTVLKLVRDWVPSMEWLPRDGGLFYASRKDQKLTVHLGDRDLATHQGASVLGADSTAPLGVVSPDNSWLAYSVSYETGGSQLFVAHLVTGEVRAVPESTDLFPLMWTADGTNLLVAYSPLQHAPLPGGGEAVGRAVADIRLIHPPGM